MTNKNIAGLTGVAPLLDEGGQATGISSSAFFHHVDYKMDDTNETIRIFVKAWESKSEFVNKSAGITNHFSTNEHIIYNVTDDFKVKKGRDRHDGDGVEVTFDFTKNMIDENHILVIVDDVILNLGEHYTVSFDSGSEGTGSITFNTAPPLGSNNVVIYKQNKGFSNYFSKFKQKTDGVWIPGLIQEFLGDLDGTDKKDKNGIDYTVATKEAEGV